MPKSLIWQTTYRFIAPSLPRNFMEDIYRLLSCSNPQTPNILDPYSLPKLELLDFTCMGKMPGIMGQVMPMA